ncbi:hypothetical protein EJB05_15333, partial [Eragrostis curvula]
MAAGARRRGDGEEAGPNWAADRILDPMQVIAARVLATGGFLDYVRFRAVCTQWRAAAASPRGCGLIEPRFHPRRWMLYGQFPGHRADGGHARFFDLSTAGAFVRVPLPELKNHCILDSPDGLLLLQRDEDSAVRLLHPFTGDVAELPSLKSLAEQLNGLENDRPLAWYNFPVWLHNTAVYLQRIRKVCAAINVTATGVVTVMLALEQIGRVAFASAGDCDWTISSWVVNQLDRVLPYQGKLYVVNWEDDGLTNVLLIDPPPPRCEGEGSPSEQTIPPPRTVATFSSEEIHLPHLVELNSEVMLVGYNDSSFSRILVLKLADLVTGRTVPVRSIGDNVLFAGARSLCVSSRWLPAIGGNSVVCFHAGENYLALYDLRTGTWSPANDGHHMLSPPPRPCDLIHHIFTCCNRQFWNKGLMFCFGGEHEWRVMRNSRYGAQSRPSSVPSPPPPAPISPRPSPPAAPRRRSFSSCLGLVELGGSSILVSSLASLHLTAMAKHHPDLIMCRKQPGIAIGRLCEKCDGKCVVCDSYVRPCTLVRVCDECNYGSFQGRCVICGGVGISDAYYCKECTQQEKDRDGCPKIVNLGSAKTDLFYERKKKRPAALALQAATNPTFCLITVAAASTTNSPSGHLPPTSSSPHTSPHRAAALPTRAMAATATAVRFQAVSGARHVATSRRARLAVFRAQSAPAAAAALTQDDLKRLAAVRAVEQVQSGMVLGLGTGSTAAFAVAEIGALLAAGKLSGIVGVPTSKRTYEQAKSLGIPLSTLDDHPRIDLAIDGSDEVDPDLNLVKGRGGALLREKMVEAASDKFIVIVDETKLVSGLGGSGLAMPVEVVQFCWKYNLVRLQELFKEEGVEAKLRLEGDKPYVTDNSNYIVDLYFKTPIKDALAAGKEISTLEGVVEHGLFLDMASSVIIAGSDGVSVKTNFEFGHGN